MKIKHTQQVDFSNPNADKITSGVTNKPIKKETAIEWLVNELENHHVFHDIKNTVAYQQSKAMEKEDLRKFFSKGWTTRERFDDLVPDMIYPEGLDYEEKQEYAFEQYYKKTYGK